MRLACSIAQNGCATCKNRGHDGVLGAGYGGFVQEYGGANQFGRSELHIDIE